MPSPRHWLLPKDTDPLAALRDQMAITVQGMAAFAAWAGGEASAQDPGIEAPPAAGASTR